MPQKMRRAALRSALSVKAAGNEIVLVDDLKLSDAKTRLMAEALQTLVEFDSVLILLPEKDEQSETITRATKNLNDAKTLQANYLNVRDLLGYDKLIVPVKALDVIKNYLG
jgi:large subunit ribosomal protein L4